MQKAFISFVFKNLLFFSLYQISLVLVGCCDFASFVAVGSFILFFAYFYKKYSRLFWKILADTSWRKVIMGEWKDRLGEMRHN